MALCNPHGYAHQTMVSLCISLEHKPQYVEPEPGQVDVPWDYQTGWPDQKRMLAIVADDSKCHTEPTDELHNNQHWIRNSYVEQGYGEHIRV